MFELPTPISSVYKLYKTIQVNDTRTENIEIYLEVDFAKSTFRILDYKKREGFVFHNGAYAYRWAHIAELISQATNIGIALTDK